MKCFFCKGDMAEATTTHVVELGACIVIVRNVPCLKCTQCGEVVLRGNVVHALERIVSTLQNVMTEVAIVNYPKRVA